jgi:hypothetical protein
MRVITIGERFARLVVKALANNKKSHQFFIVECDCGVITKVRGDALISGRQKSCGCYRREILNSSFIARI